MSNELLKWTKITQEDLKARIVAEGLYVVKTITNHPLLSGRTLPGNVLEASLHYNDNGKAIWSCNNQVVTEVLMNTPGYADHYFNIIHCITCDEKVIHEIDNTYTFCTRCGTYIEPNE